jgi:hypothetical protein
MIIGISNLPASYDGALMADLSPTGEITPEFTLDEQGVADKLLISGMVVVLGCDASLGDDWTLGNIYIRDRDGVWTKKRTLENVIHAWGACLHNDKLYVATGAHIGDNATWEARVYISEDLGDTWTYHYVCYYRIYDIISFDGVLYANAWNWPNYELWKSVDDGATWSKVEGVTPKARVRLTIFDNRLVGVTSGGASIFTIDTSGGITNYSIPDGMVHQYNFNSLVVANGSLYVLTTQKIWKKESLATAWTYHCNLGLDCLSIGDFTEINKLIVSTKGVDAKILQVDY